ncbi:aminoacyl-tRNA hydrolase [Candidatus Peregrinibacteria bacterium]|nr:aminoacyl-tRNA hydrolase [Candidatus Peregrinibacteria bacterium]
MKIFVGLGNPGKEYQRTRHNIGFLFFDYFLKKFEFSPFRKQPRFKSEISEGVIGEEKILLLKPMTFMNLSGQAVASVKDFFRVSTSDIWLFYDDVALPFGDIRVRFKGSAGSHNGMKSIIEHLSSGHFPRFRMGIENRDANMQKQQDLSSYVLSFFREDEITALNTIFQKMIEIVEVALADGITLAKEKFEV